LVRELGGFNVFSDTPNLVAAKVTAIWMRERKQTGGPDREDNTIIVIGRGYRAEDLRRSLRYFAGAAAGSRPPM
jgi:hypothetical protein